MAEKDIGFRGHKGSLLKEGEGIPAYKERAGQIRIENGTFVNPVETFDESKESPLWHEGPNYTEDLVEIVIGDKLQVVTVTRSDSGDNVNSVVGGFVDKGEVWGSGSTAIRENNEEIGQDIKKNQLIPVDSWYCHDSRSNNRRWIETSVHLVPILRQEELDFKPDTKEVKQIGLRDLNEDFLSAKFFADHRKSITTAVRVLEERLGMVVDKDGVLRLPENIREVADKWANTGRYQLQRIVFSGKNVAAEVARRELLADELTRSENPVSDFFEDFENYSTLLEALVDGEMTTLGKFVRKNIPLLGLYTQNEIVPDNLATQDYPESGPGLPGIDWSLFDKAVIRMSRNIIENMPKYGGKIDNALIASALLLDVSKAKNTSFVHNVASAEMIRKDGILERIIKDPLMAEFFAKMVEYHGYIGQISRGEVTEYILTGLTDWLIKNRAGLEDSLEKFGVKPDLPDFAGDVYHAINVLDTSSVRKGLYKGRLVEEFNDLRDLVKDVVRGDFTWDEVRSESLQASNKVAVLAERLMRLRGGKDYEEVLGTILEISGDDHKRLSEIYDLLEHAQLWYVENATAHFSVENQLKLLVLASKIAKGKGVDEYGNFDVNFAPLMNTLRPGKNLNRAVTRIIDTSLSDLNWEEILATPNTSEIVVNPHLKITITGEHGITGADCILDETMREACDLINVHYSGKREVSSDFIKAVDSLNNWTGIKLDEWDRVFDQASYEANMNTTMPVKIKGVSEMRDELRVKGKPIVAIGVGAGTAKLEEELALNSGKDDVVIALDASRAMYENAKRAARFVSAVKYLHPERGIAEMKAILKDASELKPADLGVDYKDSTVLFSFNSVLHELPDDVRDGVFKNVLGILKVGDGISIRDFMQSGNPGRKSFLKLGEAKEGEISPVHFVRNIFLKQFEHLTKDEEEEIMSWGEIKPGTTLRISDSLAMELAGHYSWMMDGGSLAEIRERYGHFNSESMKKWINSMAKDLDIKVAIEISEEPGGYEKFLNGKMELTDEEGKVLPVPLWMGTVKVKRLS